MLIEDPLCIVIDGCYGAIWYVDMRCVVQHERVSLASLNQSILSLRIQSNLYNSPSTFALYALIQRKLQKQLKERENLCRLSLTAQHHTTASSHQQYVFDMHILSLYGVYDAYWSVCV